MTHHPTKTAEDISVILNNLERYTHRGMWWVRLDRVREEFEHLQKENERYIEALRVVVAQLDDEKVSDFQVSTALKFAKESLSPSPQ